MSDSIDAVPSDSRQGDNDVATAGAAGTGADDDGGEGTAQQDRADAMERDALGHPLDENSGEDTGMLE